MDDEARTGAVAWLTAVVDRTYRADVNVWVVAGREVVYGNVGTGHAENRVVAVDVKIALTKVDDHQIETAVGDREVDVDFAEKGDMALGSRLLHAVNAGSACATENNPSQAHRTRRQTRDCLDFSHESSFQNLVLHWKQNKSNKLDWFFVKLAWRLCNLPFLAQKSTMVSIRLHSSGSIGPGQPERKTEFSTINM